MNSILTFIKTDRFKKYFLNTGWMMTERAFSLGILFVVGILIARYLGPKQFGILSYAISISMLASPLCFMGLEGIVTRDLINDPSNEEEILGTAFTLMILGSALGFGLIVFFTAMANPDPNLRNLLFIISLSLIFDSFHIFRYYYQAKVQTKYIAISTMITVLLASGYRLLLIYQRLDVFWFGAAVLIQKIIFAFMIHFFYQRTSKSRTWSFSFSTTKSLLKDSWPLLLSGFSVLIYMYFDQAILMWLKGARLVGEYAVAVKISEVWYFIPMIICTSIFPALVSVKKNNPHLYEQRLLRLYQLMILIALVIMAPLTVFAPAIIRLLFGAEYLAAAGVLRIHIWSAFFVFLGTANNIYLVIENYTLTSLSRTMIGMILNIFLNLMLIPSYGIMGAAIATVISYAAATFSIVFDKKTRGQAHLMLRAFNIFNKI